MITSEEIEALSAVESDLRDDGSLRRGVTVHDEFDCFEGCHWGSKLCRPGSGGFHGQGGREITWWVAAPGRGGVAARLLTPIHTDRSLERARAQGYDFMGRWTPLGDLTIHRSEPANFQEDEDARDCYLIGRCWPDVTFMQAEEYYEAFKRGGTPGVWAWLGESWLPAALK